MQYYVAKHPFLMKRTYPRNITTHPFLTTYGIPYYLRNSSLLPLSALPPVIWHRNSSCPPVYGAPDGCIGLQDMRSNTPRDAGENTAPRTTFPAKTRDCSEL